MLPRTYIYIMIVVTLISISGFGLIQDGGEPFGVGIESNSTVYNLTNQIANSSLDLQSKVNTGEVSGLDFLDFIVDGAWKAILTLLSVPAMFQTMIEETAIALGIGEFTWLLNLVIYGFIISVVFAVISSIFRRKT